jgi:hypothetical protein
VYRKVSLVFLPCYAPGAATSWEELVVPQARLLDTVSRAGPDECVVLTDNMNPIQAIRARDFYDVNAPRSAGEKRGRGQQLASEGMEKN